MRKRLSLHLIRPLAARAHRRRSRRTVATAGLAIAAVLVAGTPAFASWVQGQTVTTGKVTKIVDGDTELVDVYGDGISTPQTIRNTGIQAMELGQCHSSEATKAMTAAALGKTVRLSAHSASASSLGRPVRYVDSASSSGYVDTQVPLLLGGHALALTVSGETSRWRNYMYAEQKAKVAGKNLWDPDYCKSGPQQSNPLKIWVNYDGDGNEQYNVNSEYVRIVNEGTTTLSLTGWWVRTAAQDYYRFPAGSVIKPRSLITLFVGKGTRTATWFYWGFSTPHFPNSDVAGAYGSGAYLFDPDGDLRAHTSFPCLYSCSDSRVGQVAMRVSYNPAGDDQANPNGEYVVLTARGTKPINLSFTTLWENGNSRELGGGSILNPGERMVIHMGKGRSSRLSQYWNKSYAPLTNSGGSMVLRTTNGIRITCAAWQAGRC